jgi:ComF family protein
MTFRSVAAELASFFFPLQCAACGRIVCVSDYGVCSHCAAVLQLHRLPSDFHVASAERKYYFDESFSLFFYEDAVCDIISSFKKGHSSELGSFFGRELCSAFKERLAADTITFIPISEQRKKERGYNQAELLALSLGKEIGRPVGSFLNTSSSGNQKKMHYHERFLNMLGRFTPGKESCAGKSVLLVDDVFTTGSTVNEASRVLKKMGAVSVFSLTVARVNSKKL